MRLLSIHRSPARKRIAVWGMTLNGDDRDLGTLLCTTS
ncbi:hypothetical protein a10_08687 [Streptomyces acidiscabies]|nr:hypothetical protein a10_08687 [Streptomyces acidiscabies]GAV45768.1 hypothetical protein Saa2_08760 [Streptomyces acidiscabies]